MKIFAALLITSSFACSITATASASPASPRPLALARCQQMVDAYNRCETHVVFHPEKNLIEFPSLNRSAVCDDGLELPFLQRLKHPDVASMLSQPYTAGPVSLPERRENFSPGGIRVQDFMMAVYGATEQQVKSELVDVDFLGQRLKFNQINGAARALSLVGRDLMALYHAKTDPALTAYLRPFVEGPCSGQSRCNLRNNTFDWRLVAGTTSLSNHSFGTAIDMQPASGTEYWIWDLREFGKSPQAVWKSGSEHTDLHDIVNFEPRTNPGYPKMLVEAFERHGFIWGGKWYRYDIMHFEFRPEFYPAAELGCRT